MRTGGKVDRARALSTSFQLFQRKNITTTTDQSSARNISADQHQNGWPGLQDFCPGQRRQEWRHGRMGLLKEDAASGCAVRNREGADGQSAAADAACEVAPRSGQIPWRDPGLTHARAQEGMRESVRRQRPLACALLMSLALRLTHALPLPPDCKEQAARVTVRGRLVNFRASGFSSDCCGRAGACLADGSPAATGGRI